MITDGIISYAVYTYRCGDMNWAYGPTIGFNAAGDYYVNHPNTGSTNGEEIACLNSPASQWYNLVYEISLPNATNLTAELPTVEPRKFVRFCNSRYEGSLCVVFHFQLKAGTCHFWSSPTTQPPQAPYLPVKTVQLPSIFQEMDFRLAPTIIQLSM